MKIILVILVYICISLPLSAMEQTNSLYIKCTWPRCTSSFANTILLYAHIKAHEECEGKIYPCTSNECKQYFYTKQHLESHNRDYHPTMTVTVAKKIKKCGGANKRVRSSKKRKSRALEIKTSPSLPAPPAKPQPKMLTPPPVFKVPLHPATQALLICLERRRPMHEQGKEAILYRVPFKVENDGMVKTTGTAVRQLIKCPIKECSERFATIHGRLYHLIHVHEHELYTSTFES